MIVPEFVIIGETKRVLWVWRSGRGRRGKALPVPLQGKGNAFTCRIVEGSMCEALHSATLNRVVKRYYNPREI
jgi:hypothetical protein